MLIPLLFIKDCEFKFQQICKRAENILWSMSENIFIISDKKFLTTKHYEVNCFGLIQHKYGNLNNLLERLLEEDLISSEDYQLLKFYNLSDGIAKVLEILQAESNESGLVDISPDEFIFLVEVSTFEEDSSITKEELLHG